MENKTMSQHYSLNKKVLMPIIAVVMILLAVYLVSLVRNSWKAYDYIGRSPEFQERVNFTGTGKVTAKPDVAVINIGLITEKINVNDAQNENTAKMNKIISQLKDEFKIDEDDIKTSQYSVNPRYNWNKGVRSIAGYEVNQIVTIKVRDFDKVGDILSMAGSIGANSISGPNFTIDDPEIYKKQAREKAIAKAKAKADILAEQVGIKLGKIVSFSESGAPQPIYYDMMVKNETNGIGGGSTPIVEAGSQEVSVTVNIGYEIL